MDASVKLEQGMRFVGSADTGLDVAMDSSPAVGGDNSAPRPMELILIGLCGCTAMDVISILRKKRESVSGLEVKAHADRTTSYPKVFTDITLEYIVTGHNVSPRAVERAIKLSSDTYCPVQAMLALGANIDTTYKIIEDA